MTTALRKAASQVHHRQFHKLNSTETMKTKLILGVKLVCLSSVMSAMTSCVAGRVDRVEDRYDRHSYSGRGDLRENVNDKFRGRRGIRY
jgi:hypothetical protein